MAAVKKILKDLADGLAEGGRVFAAGEPVSEQINELLDAKGEQMALVLKVGVKR